MKDSLEKTNIRALSELLMERGKTRGETGGRRPLLLVKCLGRSMLGARRWSWGSGTRLEVRGEAKKHFVSLN